MKTGRSSGRSRSRLVVRIRPDFMFLALFCLAGCAGPRPHVDQALMADHGGFSRGEGVAEQYIIACPDVLDISIEERPDLRVRQSVGPDGRVDLGAAGMVRVEGQTPAEAAVHVAVQVGVPTRAVHVEVEA